MAYVQRGLDQTQEQNYANLIRDTRTLGQRVRDFFHNPEGVAVVLIALALGCFLLPAAADYCFLFGLGAFLVNLNHKEMLPFRLPKRSKMKDYNSPKPGSRKPSLAAGIYFFGNDIRSGSELWFTNEDMRTHVLIFGSTGSGKTEALVSIAYNALLQSSGFIYVDGKGDNSLFSKIFSMVRYMGREDDMLLINFMTGARDIIGPQKKRLSNTMNPFASGSSSMVSQLIISLMDSSSDSSSGDMWKGRAIAFVEALMKILVAMRDTEYLLLDANVIRNYFALERLEAMVIDKVFIRDGQDAVSLEKFPEEVLEPIKNYLITLPGYNKEKKGKQVSQVLEQHGFITMQLTRVFTSLADTYGHILRTNLAEVDLRDVVLNRRILTVLLPALEKSPDELANLGKVIIASLKAMMAAGLGEEVEGEYRDIVSRKPTNARTPYLCILDEYGYYAVPGFAVVPAQARSLGFSVIFAGQDLPALQKASKEEAATIGANTNIKICMKLEDPIETWDFFMKTAGESYVSQVESFQTDAKSMTNQYMDSRSARMEKRARVDLLDLKEQREGEMHIFFKSKIVRASAFYANPKPVKSMRLNHFLKVSAPTDSTMRTINNGFYKFNQLVKQETIFPEITLDENDEISKFAASFCEQEASTNIEKGIAALMAMQEKATPAPVLEDEEQKLSVAELNIFTKLRLTDTLRSLLLAEDLASFEKPFLEKVPTSEQIEYIEKLSGKSMDKARNVSIDLINDMVKGTYYPPNITTRPTGAELGMMVEDVVKHIAVKKQEKKSE